jgi:hypothetical protein
MKDSSSEPRPACTRHRQSQTAANAAFFTEGEEPLGSPGWAANVGALVRDVAFVPNHQVPTVTSSPAYEPTCA